MIQVWTVLKPEQYFLGDHDYIAAFGLNIASYPTFAFHVRNKTSAPNDDIFLIIWRQISSVNIEITNICVVNDNAASGCSYASLVKNTASHSDSGSNIFCCRDSKIQCRHHFWFALSLSWSDQTGNDCQCRKCGFHILKPLFMRPNCQLSRSNPPVQVRVA